MNLRLWIEFQKQLKSVSGAADSVKRFDSDETGNPYRFDSDETGGIKFFAFNAKKYLIFDSGYPIFFLVGGKKSTRCYYKEFIR